MFALPFYDVRAGKFILGNRVLFDPVIKNFACRLIFLSAGARDFFMSNLKGSSREDWMNGERDLTRICAAMRPLMHGEIYVYCCFQDFRFPAGLGHNGVFFTFREREGLTAVVQKQTAERLALPHSFESRWSRSMSIRAWMPSASWKRLPLPWPMRRFHVTPLRRITTIICSFPCSGPTRLSHGWKACVVRH